MVTHRLERVCLLAGTSGVQDGGETRQGPGRPLWAFLVLIALAGLLLAGPTWTPACSVSPDADSVGDAADLDSDPVDSGPRPAAAVALASARRPASLTERAQPAPCRRRVPPPRSFPA